VNSPEDGPVGPKHVEIRRYMNKIETVTSVGFSFLTFMKLGKDERSAPQTEYIENAMNIGSSPSRVSISKCGNGD